MVKWIKINVIVLQLYVSVQIVVQNIIIKKLQLFIINMMMIMMGY
jgi:hypothetical protein